MVPCLCIHSEEPGMKEMNSVHCAWVIIKVSGHQHWWLAGGYDLQIGHFWRWLAWWLPGE